MPAKLKIFVFGVLVTALTLLPAAARGFEHDLLFGGYVNTLRNLDTQGMTLAYHLWITPSPERSREGASFLYPLPFNWGLELKGGRLNRPQEAWEVALLAQIKYELEIFPRLGFFATLGGGGSYTEAEYTSIPTDYSFVGRIGLGCRIEHFLIQVVYEHRSNGGIVRPNRGLDLIETAVGFRF